MVCSAPRGRAPVAPGEVRCRSNSDLLPPLLLSVRSAPERMTIELR
jgi:hypothetical protein